VASFSDITTLVTGGGTITFNQATGNTYWIDPTKSSGLGMGQIRAPIDNKGQTSGYILHTFFEEGTHLILAGVLVADTTANRNTQMVNLKAALRSILTTTGTLNFGAGDTAAVKCDIGCDFPQWSGNVKGFVFGLVTSAAF
jgi:hypothetical protein